MPKGARPRAYNAKINKLHALCLRVRKGDAIQSLFTVSSDLLYTLYNASKSGFLFKYLSQCVVIRGI